MNDLDHDMLCLLDAESLQFRGPSPKPTQDLSRQDDLSMTDVQANGCDRTGMLTPIMLSDDFQQNAADQTVMKQFPNAAAPWEISSMDKGASMARLPSHEFAPGIDFCHGGSSWDDIGLDLNANEASDSGDFEDELTDQDIGDSMQIAASGHVKYMGPSMSFIPGSYLGHQWITKITGSAFLAEQMRVFLSKWNPDDTESIIEASEVYNENHLPTYDVALTYIDAYFKAVQCVFPILNRQDFMHKFATTYHELKPNKNPTHCAMVNITLAIGCRAIPDSNEDQISGLFQNALGSISRVLLGYSHLSKVQVLMLMYLFLSQTTTPHWGYIILAAAVREAEALGMHLQPAANWGFSRSEMKQRSLIFWSLYCLDIQLAFRIGRSPMLRRKEISLKPPFQRIDSPIGLDGGQPFLDALNRNRAQEQLFLFNVEMCHFAQRAYDLITSDYELEALERAVVDLEHESLGLKNTRQISQFSSSVNQDWVLDPSVGMEKFLAVPLTLQFPVALLNTSVFWIQSILRLRLFSLKAAQSLSGTPEAFDLLRDTFPSASDLDAASEAAASLVKLSSVLPKGNINFFWYLQPLPAYAFNVLFLAVLDRPAGPKAHEFMDLMSIVIESTVNTVTAPNASMADLHLTHFLTFFARSARRAIQQAKGQL
ncbi:hypothetical protein Z517_07611 [Fonsecaea pedrosoi CBS 271.37]|uniref:Xylanolytic transcriptional activator regulatory domain-containing protein n=1 Tax=Fonsecaea pedrosoi CBS 271.37 TaxID=1442368 RepID=A0A0D2GAX0_9EURO|nr:uncharacterized protein Z517_07611 [Fonsecaea pedrosoi CBS 271.37]KIW77778.1 hypothetical protein Z517_07611 [Fonsecaea pedrosoi CBS 271.37]